MSEITELLSEHTSDEISILLSEKIIKEYDLDLNVKQVSESFNVFRKYVNKSRHSIKHEYTFIPSHSLINHEDLFTAIILAPKTNYF